MSADKGGLRFRVSRAARQIQSQHDRLRPIFNDVGLALSGDRAREAQTEIFRLEGALQAHFSLEEQVVFPALRGLHPNCSGELLVLEQDHERVRQEIHRIILLILAKKLDLAAEALDACVGAIVDHERIEQGLLDSLGEFDGEE